MAKATVVAGGNVRTGALPSPLPADLLSGSTGDITTTADTAVIAAQGSGTFIYVGQLVIQNSHATVGTWVIVKSGTTARYAVYCAPAGGGATITFPEKDPLRLATNEALNVACLTTGANVRASAAGFKATF